LILIAGFRPIGVGKDSANYALYLTYSNLSIFDKEPMFGLLKYINSILFNSEAQTFFIMFAILGVTLKIVAIMRLSLLPLLSIITYISLYFVLHEMTQIRAGVAAGFFLLAIPDIVNRNKKKFLIKIFLASLFHYSAIVMIFTYFINAKKINLAYYLIFPLVGFLFASEKELSLFFIEFVTNLLPDFLSSKINLYLLLMGSGTYDHINIFNFYYTSLVFIYLLSLSNYKMFKSEYDLLMIKILGIMLTLFYLLSALPVLAFRVSELFGVVLIILIPHMLLLFKQKLFVLLPLLIWLLTYFFAIMLSQNLKL